MKPAAGLSLAGMVLGAGVAVWWMKKPPDGQPPPPAHAPAAPSAPTSAEDTLRLQLAKTPCDEAASVALADSMVARNAWADLQKLALASVDKCPTVKRMARYLGQADVQLHDDVHADTVLTDLIAADATDSALWAWHGAALAHMDRTATAIAEDRQAIALALDATAAQLGVEQLAAANATCDADRARAYAARFGGTAAPAAGAHAAPPPACAPDAGTGTATLKGSAQVTIGTAVPVAMAIDRSLGTTIISPELAARAGIAVPGVDVGHAASRGTLYVGTLARATIKIGDAAAQNVDVLVTDQLHGDGIIGLSFLWHFAIAPHDGGGFTIGPPP